MQNVPGIVAVAQEMFIGRRPGMTDADIAAQAVQALRHTARVDGVRVTVHDQTLTLTGEVDWPYEREAACRAVNDIGYNGWVTVELYPYIDNPDAAARTALERIRHILATIDTTGATERPHSRGDGR